MKRWLKWIIVALLVVVLFWWLSRPEALQVSVITPETGIVENTVANTRAGTVKACQRSRLSLQIGGQIDTLNVTEGDVVKQGQLLMSLWNKDREARVRQAEAALRSAQSEKNSVCINASSDQRESKRLIRLVEQKLTSREQADLAASRADASAAACEGAKARVVQGESELTLSKAQLAQTELYAPFDGIVAEVTGEIGEYSTPSPPGVATPPAIDLLTSRCHYISAPIDEVDASDIAVGMPVRVTLDAFRDQVFEGTVRRIAPYVLEQEKQARTVEVEVELAVDENDASFQERLLAGYSADIEIILESTSGVMRLPSELIVDESFVFLVNKSHKVEKRPIEKGLANWRYTQILSGLKTSDRLVSNVGVKGLEEGVAVKISDSP